MSDRYAALVDYWLGLYYHTAIQKRDAPMALKLLKDRLDSDGDLAAAARRKRAELEKIDTSRCYVSKVHRDALGAALGAIN